MPRATIRIAQFLYRVPVEVSGQDKPRLSVRHAFRGETVEIPDKDYERGLKARAFVEDEEEQPSPVEETAGTGGEELDFSNHEQLVAWIKDDKPTAHEVVDAADGDPTRAEALLRAEEEASGGQPRKSVEEPLRKLQTDEEEE